MVRHSRARTFTAAPHELPDEVDHWSRLTSDPNNPAALAQRARALRAAWRPDIDDRVRFLEDRCRGRNVLDIGCVAHDTARLDGDDWLHGRIVRVADRCVGVDILAEGVAEMIAAGFDAVTHDLSTGLGPLAARGPFDVILAGELLEHIPDLDMVLRAAAEGLTPGGQLIVTTPNPYAPHRVRAGQLGIVWENADHVSYLFPSGMAELADRHGLRLAEAATTSVQRGRTSGPIKWLKRTIRGGHWRNVGYTTVGPPAQALVDAGPFVRTLRRAVRRPQRRFLGETFVYVVTWRSGGHLPPA